MILWVTKPPPFGYILIAETTRRAALLSGTQWLGIRGNIPHIFSAAWVDCGNCSLKRKWTFPRSGYFATCLIIPKLGACFKSNYNYCTFLLFNNYGTTKESCGLCNAFTRPLKKLQRRQAFKFFGMLHQAKTEKESPSSLTDAGRVLKNL